MSQQKEFLSGNEAIAYGAYKAGCTVAAAYPGTPSSEILPTLTRFKDRIYCEWSVNEKVAMEVVIGASFAGARALTTMKHVGLNVAADPLMTLSYLGVNGGLVIVCADDPGLHSSQNEQDNRFYAKFAKIPLLEPSDSQEAYEMVQAAFALSEEFDTPVLLRTTTRTSHSSSVVDLGDFAPLETSRTYTKDLAKNLPVPMYARQMRVRVEARLEKLRAYTETSPFQRVEPGGCRPGLHHLGYQLSIRQRGLSRGQRPQAGVHVSAAAEDDRGVRGEREAPLCHRGTRPVFGRTDSRLRNQGRGSRDAIAHLGTQHHRACKVCARRSPGRPRLSSNRRASPRACRLARRCSVRAAATVRSSMRSTS